MAWVWLEFLKDGIICAMKNWKKGIALILVAIAAVAVSAGCKPETESAPPRVEDTSDIGYVFGTVETFTDPGMIDLPCLVADAHLRTMHLTYLFNDGGSQRIQYMMFQNGEIAKSSLLSEHEGTKAGGGHLAPLPGRLVAYWVNIKATGGTLWYRIKSGNDDNFTRPEQWNRRNEARWPVVLDDNGRTNAFFFIHPRSDWELVGNYNFSAEDEQTLDVPQGNPFHLQGVSGEKGLNCLAYFERESDTDSGRIAFLRSTDSGRSFLRKYLFDDLKITNLSSFFRMERAVKDRDRVIHLIYTEENPDMTTLYYSRSDDDGENFTVPVAIFTSEVALARSPLLIANGGNVFIATADTEADGPAIRYVFSNDGGQIFSAPKVALPGVASPETITGAMADDGSIIMVWDDLASDMTDGEQLYKMEGHPAR